MFLTSGNGLQGQFLLVLGCWLLGLIKKYVNNKSDTTFFASLTTMSFLISSAVAHFFPTNAALVFVITACIFLLPFIVPFEKLAAIRKIFSTVNGSTRQNIIDNLTLKQYNLHIYDILMSYGKVLADWNLLFYCSLLRIGENICLKAIAYTILIMTPYFMRYKPLRDFTLDYSFASGL